MLIVWRAFWRNKLLFMAETLAQPPDLSRLPPSIQGLIGPSLLVNGPKDVTKEDFRALREALGLSQREMAEVLGVTQMTIWRSERDGPSRATIAYLERALAQGRLKLSDRKAEPE